MSEDKISQKMYELLEKLYAEGERGIEVHLATRDENSVYYINRLSGLGFIVKAWHRVSNEPSSKSACVYCITPQGRDYVEEVKRTEQQKIYQTETAKIDKKHQYRHDWMIAIFSAVGGALVGAGVTLFVEHIIF